MHIAIVADDTEKYRELITKNPDWQTDFIVNIADLWRKNEKYDLIIVEYTLADYKKQFINILKTEAELVILSDDLEVFLDQSLVNDDDIGAIVDKNDLEDILGWIEYFSAKINLKYLMEESKLVYSA